VADNSTGLNAQYSESGTQLVPGSYASTGAPGSPSPVADAPPGVGGGAVIGSPEILTSTYASSQVPANLPRIPVTQGDTSAFSDDTPVHESPIMPGPASAYLSTGAGQGHADAWTRRPWQSGAGD
jgi:hypothetical protein